MDGSLSVWLPCPKCQRDASSEQGTAWSEQTEGTRGGVEAEEQGASGKRAVSARPVEKDFSGFFLKMMGRLVCINCLGQF